MFIERWSCLCTQRDLWKSMRQSLEGRMLTHKAIKAGYYWPGMSKNLSEVIKYYDKCQRFGQTITSPPEALSSISSPWPFTQWGINQVGPMLMGKGGCRFMVVAVNYFTKWAKMEALATIMTGNLRNFLWKFIICWYGIPHAFVTNNRKQFDCELFQKWCAKLYMNYFSSPGHPQANSQVEATNKTLMKTLKKKLDEKNGAWVEYLPKVLWSYRTTIWTPTGETPFSLAFKSEAVILIKVGSISFWVKHFSPEMNDEGICVSLNLLLEKRKDAQMTMAAYQ